MLLSGPLPWWCIAWLGGCLLLGACAPREASPPPFRTHPLGPGHETDLPGERLRWVGSDVERLGALRVSAGGVRVFDSHMRRIGRMRRGPAGWELVDREGAVRCSMEQPSTDRWTLRCPGHDEWSLVRGDREEWHVLRDGLGVGTVRSGGAGESAGTAEWRSASGAEGEVRSGSPLPPLTIVVEREACAAEVHVRDSSGLFEGHYRGRRWTAQAAALHSGLRHRSSDHHTADEPSLSMLQAAALSWALNREALVDEALLPSCVTRTAQ